MKNGNWIEEEGECAKESQILVLVLQKEEQVRNKGVIVSIDIIKRLEYGKEQHGFLRSFWHASEENTRGAYTVIIALVYRNRAKVVDRSSSLMRPVPFLNAAKHTKKQISRTGQQATRQRSQGALILTWRCFSMSAARSCGTPGVNRAAHLAATSALLFRLASASARTAARRFCTQVGPLLG